MILHISGAVRSEFDYIFAAHHRKIPKLAVGGTSKHEPSPRAPQGGAKLVNGNTAQQAVGLLRPGLVATADVLP